MRLPPTIRRRAADAANPGRVPGRRTCRRPDGGIDSRKRGRLLCPETGARGCRDCGQPAGVRGGKRGPGPPGVGRPGRGRAGRRHGACRKRHLLHALREYETFYNAHRPHQGIAQARPLQPLPEPITNVGQLAQLRIHRRDRLGGLLHEYEHAACRGGSGGPKAIWGRARRVNQRARGSRPARHGIGSPSPSAGDVQQPQVRRAVGRSASRLGCALTEPPR
jgi:hypothetical protein